MKPMYALHTDANDKVLAAADFTHSYQVNDWLRSRDFEPGDKIIFAECAVRSDESGPPPAFLEPTTPPVAPQTADEEITF